MSTNEEARQRMVAATDRNQRIGQAVAAHPTAVRWTFALYAQDGAGNPPTIFDDVEVYDADDQLVYAGPGDVFTNADR